MKNRKSGFTLVELMISLLLLAIVMLLLILILRITTYTTKNFLNFTDYEYSLMHKKVFEVYNKSNSVRKNFKTILLDSKEDGEHTKIIFRNNKIYMQKVSDSGEYAGYILLLENLKSCDFLDEGNGTNNTIVIKIVDREDKTRILKLKKKDEKKEKKEKESGSLDNKERNKKEDDKN